MPASDNNECEKEAAYAKFSLAVRCSDDKREALELESACAYACAALEYARSMPDLPQTIVFNVLFRIGVLCMATNDHARAVAHLEEAAAMPQNVQFADLRGGLLCMFIGHEYEAMGQVLKAIGVYTRAHEEQERAAAAAPNPRRDVGAFDAIVAARIFRGEYAHALDAECTIAAAHEAENPAENDKRWLEYARMCRTGATALVGLGWFAEAARLVRTNQRILTRVFDANTVPVDIMGPSMTLAGDALTGLRDFGEAENMYTAAKRCFAPDDTSTENARVYTRLAACYCAQKKWDMALTILQIQAAMFPELGGLARVNADIVHAEAFIGRRTYGLALARLQHAHGILRSPPVYAEAFEWGVVNLRLGDVAVLLCLKEEEGDAADASAEALEHYTQALRLFQERLGDKHAYTVEALSKLISVQEALGHDEAADENKRELARICADADAPDDNVCRVADAIARELVM